MSEDWRDKGPLDKAAEMAARAPRAAGQAEKAAQMVQSAYGAMATSGVGGAASGMAVGSALAGPLGAVVGLSLQARHFGRCCCPYFCLSFY